MLLSPSQSTDITMLSKIAHEVDDCEFYDAHLRSCLAKNELFNITYNQNLIGFIAGVLVVDEAELLQIVILTAYQGQGLGRQALIQWHDYLKTKGVVRVVLDVRLGNKAATALYLKQGYQSVGQRKAYYKTKSGLEDALVLECNL